MLTSIVSATCKVSFQQCSGTHNIRNLYLVPKSTVRNDDENVSSQSHTVSVRNKLQSSTTYTLNSSQASAVADFLESLFERDDELAAAFLIPEESGYVVHSEFIVYRFEGCALVSSAQSFLLPLSEIKSFTGLVDDIQDMVKARKLP